MVFKKVTALVLYFVVVVVQSPLYAIRKCVSFTKKTNIIQDCKRTVKNREEFARENISKLYPETQKLDNNLHLTCSDPEQLGNDFAI